MIRSFWSAGRRRDSAPQSLSLSWREWMIPGIGLLLVSLVLAGSAPAGQRSHAQGRSKQRTQPDEHLDVTFTSDPSEVEIILQGEKIGKTENGQLIRKLLPGQYRVTATRAGYPVMQRTITVNRRTTSFNFILGPPITRPTPIPTPTPTPTPTLTPTPSPSNPQDGSASTSGTAVIDVFLDPKRMSQLKREDWQSLLTTTYEELPAIRIINS